MAELEHKHEFFYYLAVNEDGWKCAYCFHKPGEPPGFSPELDREDIEGKVSSILRDMNDLGVVYISNSSQGEGIEGLVTERCRKRRLYDQYTIARFILEALQPGHAKFWADVSRGILKGKDPRRRCWCGKLAVVYAADNRDYCSNAHERERERGTDGR